MTRAIMAEIIGHRGAAGLAPENSIAAFEMAARLGMSWVEADARLIKDGAVVLFHNDWLMKLGRVGRISNCRSDDALALNIPLLQDLLRRAPELGLNINIELKLDRGFDDRQGERLAAAVADLIMAEPPLCSLLISSFSSAALAVIRQRLPDIPLGLLFRRLPEDWRARAQKLAVRTIHARYQDVKPAEIKQITQSGYQAYLFTINDPKIAEPFWQVGLSGLFSAHPERFLNKHT